MLLWLLVATFSVPSAVQGWRQYFLDLTGGDYGTDVATSPSFGLLQLLALVQLVPSVVIVVGLFAVAFPQLRAAVVELRLGLTEQRRPVIAEIEDFLREHGADVEVRCNLARQDRLARIYPASWRWARLAVFGPFVALWRRDRPAAQAVLLHEVAHVRTGDHLFLGSGSPFVALINLWFPLLVVFGVLPVIGFALVGYPTAGMLAGQLLLLLTLIPRILLLPAAVRNSGSFLTDSSRIWGPAALLLLIWPVAARPWTRWWAGRATDRSSMPGPVHATAALLVTSVAR